MKTMHVKCSDELMQRLTEKFKDADPVETPDEFGILLALAELKRSF